MTRAHICARVTYYHQVGYYALGVQESRKQRLALAKGMNSRELWRCVEMAVNGSKSMHPKMQPADAFFGDLEIMLRTLIAGAVGPSPKPRTATSKIAKKSHRTKPGDRK